MVQSPPVPSYTLQDWQGGTRSLTEEFDYDIDQIEGEIPVELYGTLFRNGPGLLDIGGVPLKHPFDGDGMVCAIAFQNGRAHFRNRFVRTQGYLAEQAAGKILYRGVFGTAKPGGWLANAFDLRIKNIANTQVLYWGEKLLALWEADRPHRLDPATLETLGEEDLGGVLVPGSGFSAHPRLDPGGEGRPPRLVNFGLKVGLSTEICIYELDLAGQVVEQSRHILPGFAFIHDFAITPNYCIFFQNPVQLNPLAFVLGLKGPGECLSFQSGQPTKIWVIPRHRQDLGQEERGQGKIKCLETAACFVFHHANAYETPTGLVVDSICYDRFPSLDRQQDYRQVNFATLPPGELWRFQLDLETAQVQHQVLSQRCCEFPTLAPWEAGQNYRHLFLAVADQPQGNAPLQGLMKLDLLTGETQLWSAAPQGFMGEPVFVPKGLPANGQPRESAVGQAGDDAGWILALVYNARTHRSELVILDTEQFAAGPIARLQLKHHVPYGLHGSFTPRLFAAA